MPRFDVWSQTRSRRHQMGADAMARLNVFIPPRDSLLAA